MSLTPTVEQQAIIDAARNTSDSLLISALAGSAKTTTLEMIVKALPVQPILSLAFNKKIAEEMTKRLPGHCKCQTLNSLGHRVWATATGKRLVVDTKKTFNILKETVSEFKRRDVDFGETLRALSAAKSAGYVPEGKFPNAKRLISREDFYDGLDEDVDSEIVDVVLTRCIQAAYAGNVDYDDQIYMPTLFGGTFPRFPLVLVDEAQDLSALNHAMLEKLVTRRLIAVGDPWQSIYGFRGAVASGMQRIAERYDCRNLPLSVSFRCPIEVVKLARHRAPHMQWFDGAPQGSVRALTQWSPADLPDGAAVICRNNAPLFKCAMAFIKAGRGVKVVGSDIGPGLVRTLKKLGDERMKQEDVINAINRWEAEQTKKKKGRGAVADKADCLRVFASWGTTLSESVAYAEHLFQSSGPIQLLSGHKAKGLEFDVVYHLDSHRIPSHYAVTDEEREQEENLRYVITTRAKRELIFVDLEGLK